jgi:methionyl-tRNA formyltransferase
MINKKNLKLTIFLNGFRGLKIIDYFSKKKIIIHNIIVSKKFLNKETISHLKKEKKKYILISSLKDIKIKPILKNTDIALVCGFPLIFSKDLIKLPKKGFLNCHAGLMPKYRGGSPLNWQLINNEKYFGISILRINEEIDGGDIVEEKKFKILKKYNINDLHRIANNFFPQLLVNGIKKIIENKILKKQNIKKKNYYKQRSQKDSKFLFGQMNFVDADCFVRALQEPYPNPFIIYNKYKIKIKSIKRSKTFVKRGDIKIDQKKRVFLGCKDKSVQAITQNK